MKTLIVLRALPWCGKSFRANELVSELGGEIFSTDEYFYRVLKPDKPEEYSFSRRFLADAHRWNRVRAQHAIEGEVTPVIIDNTNVRAEDFLAYARYAFHQGYGIRLEEPTTPRWLEIRGLLGDRRRNKEALREWARALEKGSAETHGVPAFAIERMMWRWENDLTPEGVVGLIERVS